jgi:cell shape-determining protein MreD
VFSRLIKKDLFKDFLTPRRFKRVLWYGVYLLVVLIVQDMVLTQIRPGGVCAFIPPAAVTAVAMFEGAVPGAIFALVLGVFTDMFTPGTLITYTLLFPFIAFGVGMLAQFFVNRRFLGFMLLALAALLLTALVQTLIIAVKSGGFFSAVWTALLQTLWSLPFAALVYFPPARWIE